MLADALSHFTLLLPNQFPSIFLFLVLSKKKEKAFCSISTAMAVHFYVLLLLQIKEEKTGMRFDDLIKLLSQQNGKGTGMLEGYGTLRLTMRIST